MTIIKCYTLFDISFTGISKRSPPTNLDEDKVKQWHINRNRQINFDTIVQVISLRSQPEQISTVEKSQIKFKDFQNFGFMFEDEGEQNCYTFEFTVPHKEVFGDGYTTLGALYQDCDGVPMIKLESDWTKLPSFLDTSPELRNIYFEVISDE